MERIILFLLLLSVMCFASTASAATIAYWRFDDPNDPTIDTSETGLPVAAGNPLPDTDSWTVWRKAAHDHSGNGNHLTTWEYNDTWGGGLGWAGFDWSDDIPGQVPALAGEPNGINELSIVNAGDFPAAFTWSEQSAPSGTDIETMTPAAFTIEASFKINTLNDFNTIVGRDGMDVWTANTGTTTDPENWAPLYFSVRPGNSVGFEFTDVSGYRHNIDSDTGLITIGQWYNMVGVSDGSTLSLYLNGILVAQTDMALDVDGGGIPSPDTRLAVGNGSGSDWESGTFSVGRGLWSGGHEDRVYGYIDEVRISNTALEPSEFLWSLYTVRNPSPPNHADFVPLDPNLSWDGPADTVNTYDVYFDDDPNLADPEDILAMGISENIYPLTGLTDYFTTYYWRVDLHVNNDPNTFTGPVWDFTTRAAAPIIDDQPEQTGGKVGEDVSFSVGATNPITGGSAGLTYQWYKGLLGDTSTPVGTDDPKLIITVSSVGDYYCRVSVTADPLSYTDTDSAHLYVIAEALLHRYSFTDGENEPNYIYDSVGGAHGSIGITGITLGNNAVTMNGTDPNAFVALPGHLVSGLYDCTVMAWCEYTAPFDGWRTLACFGADDENGVGDSYLTVVINSAGGETAALISETDWSNEQSVFIPAVSVDTMVHLAAVFDRNNGEIRLYADGELAGTGTTFTHHLSNITPENGYLGWSQYDVDPLMAGMIDEFRIYDFAMDENWIIDAYLRGPDDADLNPCLDRPIVDLVPDCIVDLKDFADFANHWLECGLLSCQ